MDEESATPNTTASYAKLLVPRRHVKHVKTVLEELKLLNKSSKIAPYGLTTEASEEPYMGIHTHIPLPAIIQLDSSGPWINLQDGSYRHQFNQVFGELNLEAEVEEGLKIVPYTMPTNEPGTGHANPMLKGLKEGLDGLPQDLLVSIGLSADTLLAAFPTSYTLYRPMLLLPPNTFTSPPWSMLLRTQPLDSSPFQVLWKKVAEAVGVSHIAVNAGIPLQNSSSTSTENENENILRSPTNLTPIYGSFGTPVSRQSLTSPTKEDFENALWVTHMQNGIHQTWAPLYTMFSRGNIREKARILNLPSVTSSDSEGGRGSAAVDLYAGIGYFAFSYKKAGVAKVLCWELNPWSIEGLLRGARLNGWRTSDIPPSASQTQTQPSAMDSLRESDFLVFAESNEYAPDGLARLKDGGVHVLPIRHVNCGFLPSSKLSWRTAVAVIDKDLGGWIHVHENVGVNDIEKRSGEVVEDMRGYLDGGREVQCEHVERVKTYAPGVVHVVFDVRIGGVKSGVAGTVV